MPIKNIVTEQPVTKAKLECAKELRREMTPAEKLLWQQIRANKLGVRYRRQQVIQGFIVDFYCHPLRLRHLPQIRQVRVCIRIQNLYRRIWGRRVGVGS
ncbi:MAG: DUF559 domain-containing protein [Chloroflexi bacterium]|nr:DUF559 domain-containing protein [Chloroflexota bacterium]